MPDLSNASKCLSARGTPYEERPSTSRRQTGADTAWTCVRSVCDVCSGRSGRADA